MTNYRSFLTRISHLILQGRAVVARSVFLLKILTPLLALASTVLTVSAAEEGKWAFVPPRDDFSSNSMLDLRYLNERVAGESGYVTLSKDGNDFLLGNGKPARFWALNTSYDKANLDRHARFLAKRGINMVRF